MLFTVARFVESVERDLNTLVDVLSDRTGRSSDNERMAWQRSLPMLSVALSDPSLGGLHVQIGASAGIALEYRLPASSSWCDAVLLGRNDSGPAVSILELKDWEVTATVPGPRPGLVRQHGELRLHPSEQVRGYIEYCRTFHSTVQMWDASVAGCVYMTRPGTLEGLRSSPHDELVAQYPIFNAPAALASHLSGYLSLPDEKFAAAFVEGVYKQDRNFIIQVAKSISEPDHSQTQFVLLDGQREGFEKCMHIVSQIVTTMAESGREPTKAAVIIQGPPGSGKSVLAARLWAAIAKDENLNPKSVVFTTTSGSQRSNWERTFKQVSKSLAGRGIVWPANQYNPGLSPLWVKAARDAGHAVEVETWRENLNLFTLLGKTVNPADNSVTVAIVDEAHSLIDPSRTETRGIPPSGWTVHAGPQAYHILRTAQLSIFLLDGDQSYRDNESTRIADISALAQELHIPVTMISLADAQFRCAGSKEYVDWLDGVLDLGHAPNSATGLRWRESAPDSISTGIASDTGLAASQMSAAGGASKGTRFVFELVDSPIELDRALRARLTAGYSARLVASYARAWNSQKIVSPHQLPAHQKDFCINIEDNGRSETWSRIWNYAPAADYTIFIQAPPGSAMHEDPLCEVGCPYVIRGFDFDYLGVLWLSDLIWRNGCWQVDPKQVFESGLPKSLKMARDGNPQTLAMRIRRAYRILLSRAIRGVYIWCEDDETREHLSSLIATQP